MTTLQVPLHGGPGFHEGALPMFPFLGTFVLMLLLALALGALYLQRQGRLTLPQVGSRSPEEEAKRILAERFARGDIDSDEFMERSSMLNWTPGSEALPVRPPANRRRGR